MLQKFTSHQFATGPGNDIPDGGHTYGEGFSIAWQKGPLGAPGKPLGEPNGAFVETVIAAAMDRLEFYQASKFNCAENATAISKLKEALEALNARTQKRQKAGIEGTHEVG